MDYEQKYKEALSRARVVNPGTKDYNIVTTIFPELKKSDDERIRENAIQIIRYSMDGTDVALPLSIYKECIAWLEKQITKSKTDWSEKDETTLACLIGTLTWVTNNNYHCSEDIPKYMCWLENLKQRLNGETE